MSLTDDRELKARIERALRELGSTTTTSEDALEVIEARRTARRRHLRLRFVALAAAVTSTAAAVALNADPLDEFVYSGTAPPRT